jgi:hypothetical protein
MAEEFEFGDLQPEEGGGRSNRTFLIIAGALGGLVIVSLILLALYTFFLAPSDEDGQAATQTALALTAVAQAQQPTSRPTFTTIPTLPPTWTPTTGPPTSSPTVIPTRTQLPTSTPSDLPNTGIAEEFGIPGLLILGVSLLVLVVISRRMRVRISD